ncbi:MAG: SsrA-binding protein [Flavobacteriales bacterium]|nr:SsrA-binding protein [Flavobacteriales bacterium]
MLQKVNIKNKKAYFEYEILSNFQAGIILLGSEIKSIRNNHVNLSDSYCIAIDNEVFIRNLHIGEYKHASHFNHEPKRERKLLLNKQEINKISNKAKDKGITIIPLRLFINNKNIAKLEIAIARGKKIYDKRESIKAKDIERDLQRDIK